MRYFCIALLGSILLTTISAQNRAFPEYGLYDTDQPSKDFFKSNRQELLAAMGDSSMAVLYAAGEHVRNNDVDYMFRQSDDFYYMTGCNEPNSLLILSSLPIEVRDTSGTHMVNEILFVQPRNPAVESWTGKRLGDYGAMTVLGFESALGNNQFNRYFRRVARNAKKVFFPIPPDELRGEIAGFVNEISITARSLQGSREIRTPIHLIRKMRESKDNAELAMMRKAAFISMEGHRQMMRVCRDGMYEYQLQATFEHTSTMSGAEAVAYPCIVGSAENSTILHYVSNRKQLRDGDVIVMDCGVEYHNYACDITRTIPVSGKFTEPQLAIYNLVLEAQQECIDLIKPGINYREVIHGKAVEIIRSGLLKLGIITDSADYAKYFNHGVGHTVGLNVHDVSIDGVLQEGQVWTVEPGIYIPANSPGVDKKYWDIGVRIEDQVLVTAEGFELMTKDLPRDAKAIEKLMREEPRR